jgi:hypothetical protein
MPDITAERELRGSHLMGRGRGGEGFEVRGGYPESLTGEERRGSGPEPGGGLHLDPAQVPGGSHQLVGLACFSHRREAAGPFLCSGVGVRGDTLVRGERVEVDLKTIVQRLDPVTRGARTLLRSGSPEGAGQPIRGMGGRVQRPFAAVVAAPSRD